MTDNIQRVDPAIYGAKPMTVGDAPAPAATTPYAPPAAVPVSAATAGSDLLAVGAQARRAAAREQATVLESMGAGMTQWLPAHLYEKMRTPNFVPDQDFNSADFMRKGVDFQLDPADEAFVMKAVSAEDAQHRVQIIRDRNMAQQAMGDHPVAAFITGALDPTYLAIDVASLGAARVLRAGKLGAGGIAAGLTVGAGLVEAELTPTTPTQIVMNAMAMGAAGALSFRNGKLKPVDPEFPATELRRPLDEMQARVDEVEEVTTVARETTDIMTPPKPVEVVPPRPDVPVRTVNMRPDGMGPYKALSGRKMLKELIDGPDELLSVMAKRVDELLVDDVQVRVVPKKQLMQGSRAYYDPAQHTVYIAKGTRPEIRLHEMTHALTSHKIEYGLANPASAHGKIVAEMQQALEQARAAFSQPQIKAEFAAGHTEYFLTNLHEFVAGVFSGKSAFTDMLSNIKVWPGSQRSVLGSIVDGIRRILGIPYGEVNALTHVIGLTEALAKERLNVNMRSLAADGTGSMGIRLAPPATRAEALKQVLSSKGVAAAIEWSWHKSMSKYSDKSKEIADMLLDSPTELSGNSAASIQRALRADLAAFQYRYEDELLKAMAARGFGLFKRIVNTREAVRAQQAIERDVYNEMLRRNRAARDGKTITNQGVAPEVTAMADALDALSKRSLQELKAAGVAGADQVDEMAGYITRRWDIAKIEAIEAKLLAHGPLSPKDIRTKFVDTISVGIQRATGWDAQVASDIAGAIYDRTKRKGQFQDAEFTSHMGEDAAAQLRSLLVAEGLTGSRLDRVMDVLAGKADEAGKLPTLKARVDMHMDEAMLLPDGTRVTIADMLDTNVSAITERYLDTVSSRAALAKKGLVNPSDIVDLRRELAQSIPELSARAEAIKSFDEAINVLQGNPVGEEMLSGMRNVQAVTQMVGLASSGLWQLTEYATIMARYGAGRVVKEMLREMPFIRDMVRHEATSLREVLARNSAQDTRLRPFINRMEDNFDIPMSDSVKLSLMQSKQLVPYANAMKYVQHHQARVTANLIVDVLNRAAAGDAKALKSLAEYGLESGSMVKVSADIRAHGMDTAKWSDATWQEVRGPMTKMMDDAVLRARLGEMPQFAHTSTLGKFLFTFRSFVLAAHNKVLANTLSERGYAGLGLLLAYQMPLTVLATAVNTGLSGKPQGDMEETVKKAFTQVGALGLFSELFGVIAGTKQQFGAPGLIAVDRLYKAVGALTDDRDGNAASAVIGATPILSAILPARALGEALKDNKE